MEGDDERKMEETFRREIFLYKVRALWLCLALVWAAPSLTRRDCVISGQVLVRGQRQKQELPLGRAKGNRQGRAGWLMGLNFFFLSFTLFSFFSLADWRPRRRV